MKRLLLAVLSLVPLLYAATAPAAVCPDPLPESTLRQLDSEEDLINYVMVRWLACGPQAALPALPLLREHLRQAAREQLAEEVAAAEYAGRAVQADTEMTFEMLAIIALSISPAGVVDDFLDQAVEDSAVDADATPLERDVARYLPLLRDRHRMIRHYEAGVPVGIDFLRRELLSPQQDQLLELALVGQEIRQGHIDVARQHLARVAASGPHVPDIAHDDESDDDETEESEFLRARLTTLTEALAPVQAVSLVADAQPWVLDRSTGAKRRFRCGTGDFFGEMLSAAPLREIVLRRADADAAIAERLRGKWKTLIESPRTDSDPLLRELLRKRYTPDELKTGLDDAVASIRSNEGRAQLMLFGQALALPGSVLEGDASVPGGTRTRELAVSELAELVRAGDLYRRFGATAAASASIADDS